MSKRNNIETISLKICNWEKYQKEESRVFHRIDNAHYLDPKIQKLTDSQYRLWCTLLCLAGTQHSGGSVQILASTLRSLSHIKGVSTQTQLCKLAELNMIVLQKERKKERVKGEIRDSDGEPPDPSRHFFENKKDDRAEKLSCVWNENCGSLPKVARLSPKRKKSALARLKEKPDLEFWKELAQGASKSSWHTGQNERKWKANFDWFINTETYIKFEEGRLFFEKEEKKELPPPEFNYRPEFK